MSVNSRHHLLPFLHLISFFVDGVIEGPHLVCCFKMFLYKAGIENHIPGLIVLNCDTWFCLHI